MEKQIRYPSGMDQNRYEAIVKYADQVVKDSVIRSDNSEKTSDLENTVHERIITMNRLSMKRL